MKRIAIAIFVKTPGLSPLKTRLAADIGGNNAMSCYQHSLQITEEATKKAVATSVFDIQPFWAVAEKEALEMDIWQSFEKIYQGSGELGERLSKIYTELISVFSAVILIGADCPTISASILTNAASILCHKDEKTIFTLGPAKDGGFYLFGGNQPIEKSVWTSVTYSSDSTAKELAGQLTRRGKIHTLPILSDVDTGEDLKASLLQMGKSSGLSSSQLLFLNTFKAITSTASKNSVE